ncbi:virulence-associated E family protein [Rhizobium leguminosarum]|nr:virulence-associated E family protein [Rhizobium leguminosarum]
MCAAGVKLEQWEVEEVRSDAGKLVANSHNVAVRFLTDSRLIETLALDEMAGDIMLTRALPGMHENEAPRRLIDADIVQVQTFLQSSGFPRIGKDAVYDGMVKAARKRAFHPVRAWLNGVVWDGVPRVETWLSAYLRADDTMYTRGVGRSWLIAAVARIFKPGSKVDSLMVLEGAQGCGKSTAAHILGGEWFSDSLPDVRYGDKDLSQHLAGKWIIEIAELAATSKAEDAALKSFISRRVEKYRRPYERKESEEPRQCVFIGTTNRSDYLRDETGARRFWPVRVGGIDLIALRRDRDQLFAEALDMFRRGVPHYPDAALSALIDAEGRERTIAGDPWDDILADYVKDKTSVTVKMLLEGPLQITASNMSTGQRNRALGSLRRLGWQKGPRQAHGQPYVPPPVLSPEQLALIS